MATVSIPVGGVDLANVATRPSLYQAGAVITTGLCVYSDSTDLDANGVGKVKATDVTASASAECVGILLQDSPDDGGAVVLTNGCEVTNPTFTEGTWYVADNSGAISEFSDLSAGEYVTYVGYGNDAGNLIVAINITGETK